ncbi:hypothetical protein [Rhodoblastus sp.]|uniref:hypothetical protein n=1 Tax=Rhodoblastus sp. TaxID=1962975 RepID=UPI003F96B1F4
MNLRKILVSLVLAASLAASSVLAAQAQTGLKRASETASNQQQQVQIDRNGVLILIKSTLMALDQANKTGNYTVLRDLAAPGFAAANNAARLGDIFANLRRDRVDLSGVLVLDPQLTVMPEINPQGMLHLAGFFPSVPTQLNFEMLFAPVDGQWRLFGISTNLASSAPVAPTPPQPAPAPPHPAHNGKKPPPPKR